ncbi:MAG: hypothetical protein ABIJ12_00500 [bacterium]
MKTMRVLILIVIVLSLNSSSLLGLDWETTEIKLTTTDGLDLYSWLSKPDHNIKAPLIVLLPMMNNTHESYAPFLLNLKHYLDIDSLSHNKTTPYVLAIDLRGHGKSTIRNDSTIHWKDMTEDDFAQYPFDVKEAIKLILSDSVYNIDPNDIIVIGASIGSTTAIMLTEHMNGITKDVMLSPGENYRGMQPAHALESYKGESIIYAGKEDTYSYTSSVNLAKLNKKCELKVFETKDHGTDIINNNPEAMNYLIEWLFKEK